MNKRNQKNLLVKWRISQGANGMKIESRGKLVMIYNDHFRWTKGTLKNTEAHVASHGNGAEIFSEHI